MKKKLCEIGEIIAGGTPSTKINEYWNGKISWITPKDLSNYKERFISKGERSITEEGLNNSSAVLMPKNSILFTSRAPIGYVAIAEKELCTNQGFKSFVCNEQKCYYKYMYYWFLNNVETIKSKANGSTFQEISGSVMKNIEIELPDMKTQINIGNILDTIDKKIELNNQINDNLYELGKIIYEELFSKLNVDNSREYRLDEILEVLKDGTHNPPARIESGVPLITGQTLQNGFINYEKMTYISKEDYRNIHSKYQPQVDDLIITKIGTVGKVAILRECDIPITVHCNSAILRFKKEYMSQHYGFWMLMSKDFTTEFTKRISRTVQDFVSLGKMSEIPVKVPNFEFRKQYDEIFETLILKISHLNFQNNTLIQLRDTLLPKLMNGEINLDKIEI